MADNNSQAGAVMRAIRRRRKMTLEQAAPLLSMSVSALSRRERGLERIQRGEIELAVQAYSLSFWEAHELWQASGYLPERLTPEVDKDTWLEMTKAILNDIPYPGWFVDNAGRIVAWNTCMDKLWQLNRVSETGPIHAFDIIVFSERSKELLGDEWYPTALRMFSYNYHATLPQANDPQLQELLRHYRRKYGAKFDALWEAAQTIDPKMGDNPLDLEPSIITLVTEAGPIRFLYLQSFFPYLPYQGLFVYLPLGDASRHRYGQMCKGTKRKAYFASDGGPGEPQPA